MDVLEQETEVRYRVVCTCHPEGSLYDGDREVAANRWLSSSRDTVERDSNGAHTAKLLRATYHWEVIG